MHAWHLIDDLQPMKVMPPPAPTTQSNNKNNNVSLYHQLIIREKENRTPT
eukprot:m.120622 g.120622  ORF g.120622 m.120622 type:complete len:50 (+) comp15500_c0_seq1:159-308(+)